MDMNPVIERLMAVMQGSKQPMDPNHVPAVSLEDVESANIAMPLANGCWRPQQAA